GEADASTRQAVVVEEDHGAEGGEAHDLADVQIRAAVAETVAEDDEEVQPEHDGAGLTHHGHEERYPRVVQDNPQIASYHGRSAVVDDAGKKGERQDDEGDGRRQNLTFPGG